MASIEEHICEACATAADYATLLEESEKQQAELAQLRDQLADMTNSQHVNERSLDEYARTIARLRQELAEWEQWEDVPDGEYEVKNNRLLKLCLSGDEMQIRDRVDKYLYAIFSKPDNFRIQRRKEGGNDG